MSDLRGKISARLWDVACDADTSADAGGVNLARDEVRMAIAAECIRQMEWAREKCYGNLIDEVPTGKRVFNSLFVKGYSDEVKIEVYKKPLTPAPDDWKPE